MRQIVKTFRRWLFITNKKLDEFKLIFHSNHTVVKKQRVAESFPIKYIASESKSWMWYSFISQLLFVTPAAQCSMAADPVKSYSKNMIDFLDQNVG